MELSIDCLYITHAIRSDLATALGHSNPLLPKAIVDVRVNTTSFKLTSLELAITTIKETVPSFMERVMAAHTVTVTSANELKACTGVESASDFSVYEKQPQSK